MARRFSCFVLFACCLGLTAPAWSAEALPPRLWKALSPPNKEGLSTTVYLLGVTHFGLSSEYDDYFYARIMPAFQSADDFSFEGAGGRESEPSPACDASVLDAHGREVLAGFRSKVFDDIMFIQEMSRDLAEKAGVHDGTTKEQRARVWHTFVDSLDEFQLIQTGRTFAQARDSTMQQVRAYGPQEQEVMQVGVVENLRALRPQLPVRDLDSLYGARRAYCTAGPARIALMQSQQDAVNTNAKQAQGLATRAHAQMFRLLSGLPADPSLPANPLIAMDKTLICQRNSEWLRDMKNRIDGKAHFVAVGLQHLFKVDHDDARCGGLVEDLHDQGWQVERVENVAVNVTPAL